MEPPVYTQAQFDALIAHLQPIFQVSAINYDGSPVGTPQHRQGWRLMLLYLDLAGQTATFKVWVAIGEEANPPPSLASLASGMDIALMRYGEVDTAGNFYTREAVEGVMQRLQERGTLRYERQDWTVLHVWMISDTSGPEKGTLYVRIEREEGDINGR